MTVPFTDSYDSPNSVLFPVPLCIDQPGVPSQQKWVLILTGIAKDLVCQGQRSGGWNKSTYWLRMNPNNILASGPNHLPPGGSRRFFFQVDQHAPLATLNSIYDAGSSYDAGFAVYSVSPLLWPLEGVWPGGPRTLQNVFAGLELKLAVRDTDAQLLRVGYHVTLVGSIVEGTPLYGSPWGQLPGEVSPISDSLVTRSTPS